jgi:hypothetical protein
MKMAQELAYELNEEGRLESFDVLVRRVQAIQEVYDPTLNEHVDQTKKLVISALAGSDLLAPNLDELVLLWEALHAMQITDPALDSFYPHEDEVIDELKYHMIKALGYNPYLDDPVERERQREVAIPLPQYLWNIRGRMEFLISVFYPKHQIFRMKNVLYQGPKPNARSEKDRTFFTIIHVVRDYGEYLAAMVRAPEVDQYLKLLLLENLQTLWENKIAKDLMFDIFVDQYGYYLPVRLPAIQRMKNLPLMFPYMLHAENGDDDHDDEYDDSKIWHDFVHGGVPLAKAMFTVLHYQARLYASHAKLAQALIRAVIDRIVRYDDWGDMRLLLDFSVNETKYSQELIREVVFAQNLDRFLEFTDDEQQALFNRAFVDHSDSYTVIKCLSQFVTTRPRGLTMEEVKGVLLQFLGEWDLIPNVNYSLMQWKHLMRIDRAFTPRSEAVRNALAATNGSNPEPFLNYLHAHDERITRIIVAMAVGTQGVGSLSGLDFGIIQGVQNMLI